MYNLKKKKMKTIIKKKQNENSKTNINIFTPKNKKNGFLIRYGRSRRWWWSWW